MIIGISGRIGSGKDTVGKIIQYLTLDDNVFAKTNADIIADLEYNGYCANKSNWKIKKFAGKLKQIVSILTGIPVEDLEKQEVKNKVLGKEWNRTFYKIIDSDDTVLSKTFYKEDAELDLAYYEDYHHRTVELIEFQNRPITVRELLQELGTILLRDELHPNVHVNALFADYKPIYRKVVNNVLEGIGVYPNWIITDLRFPNELQAIKDRDGITIRVNRPKYAYESDLPEKSSPLQHAERGKELHNHPSETALDNAEFDFVIDNNKDIGHLVNEVKSVLEKKWY